MNAKANGEFGVRQATLDDLETIVRLNAAMALETEAKTLDQDTLRAGVSRLLSDDLRGFYLLAESAGQIVGQLMVTFEWSDWRNAYFWWIQSVYVAPEFRRKGVYRLLESRVKSQAQQQGDVCGIRLYVDRDNLVAQRVYTNLGMTHARYDLFEVEFDR